MGLLVLPREIAPTVRALGWNCTLFGGVIHEEGERKDLDVLLFPVTRDARPLDEVRGALSELRGTETRRSRVDRARTRSRRQRTTCASSASPVQEFDDVEIEKMVVAVVERRRLRADSERN
jgi:hypothetical protein